MKYFTKTDLLIWFLSISIILLSFILFDRENILTLCASLIGATSLIFNAKGNPFGQFLMIVFSCIYGYISFQFAYYGEMITYVGMTAPMSLFSLITWLKHPYNGNKNEVQIHILTKDEIVIMFIYSIFITIFFMNILIYFHTTNIILSTISITTSFLAVYLTYKRSSYFALAYACNDIILILLWIYASISDISYISVVLCFIIFLINDIYGFINWKKIEKKQMKI